ncbi:MAG: GspH/FimT family protein [Kiritimatiellales bacterium]
MKYENMKKPNSSFIFHLSSFASGFTLIEVLLVVVIILIATGISVPLFKGSFQATQMQDAVRSTLRMTRYARSMAIIKQDTCTLEFSDTRIAVRLPGETNSTAGISRRLPDDIKISRFENQAEPDADEESGRNVRFYSSGMNDGFELTFSDTRDRRMTVTCNPITGKTVVEDGH